MSRTIVYIDALNLYYRALKRTAHKWLDLDALARAVLPASYQIIAINYYTANVSGRTDPGAPIRQHAYLRALKSLPLVTAYFGNFSTNEVWAGLVQPPDFRPRISLPSGAKPVVAYVYKTEEKGSDVNLGVHLVRDAFQKKFETAAVLTDDTDLAEPMRIVGQELGMPLILLTPTNRPGKSLTRHVIEVRHIGPYLGPCQLPNPVILPNGKRAIKPSDW
jgi:hypothetical protein